MNILAKFQGREAFELIGRAAQMASEEEGCWAQEASLSENVARVMTFSEKGEWVASFDPEKDETEISFSGYRGSFADGVGEFKTSSLPWENSKILLIESSQPERPVETNWVCERGQQTRWELFLQHFGEMEKEMREKRGQEIERFLAKKIVIFDDEIHSG